MEISLQRRHALLVKDCAFSHKIEYAQFFGNLPTMPVNAIDSAGTSRDKQGQAGTKQGQAGKGSEKQR